MVLSSSFSLALFLFTKERKKEKETPGKVRRRKDEKTKGARAFSFSGRRAGLTNATLRYAPRARLVIVGELLVGKACAKSSKN